jgi:hypothetical protein
MRVLPILLKLVGAIAIAIILRSPVTFPRPGAGLALFLLTFSWPLLFAVFFVWCRRGPFATALRVLEVPLLVWTTFITWYATAMDPAPQGAVMGAGIVAYAVGAAWQDAFALRDWNDELTRKQAV